MSNITSAAAFFRAANGKQVVKTVEGVLTVEAWPAWLAGVVANLKAQGATEGDDYTVTDKGLNMKDGRFVMRPKLRAREAGVLNIRSADYAFLPVERDGPVNPIYGDKKGATVEGGALVKRYPNGMIVRFEMAA